MTTVAEETKFLKSKKNVAMDKNGVDAWGIYVSFVEPRLGTNEEVRVFVAGKLVCEYRRKVDGARTTWRRHVMPSREAALAWLAGTGPGCMTLGTPHPYRTMAGAPVLVQLTESDVDLIRKDRMPAARYRGQAKHEALYGKIEMMTDLAANLSGDMPNGAFRPTKSTSAFVDLEELVDDAEMFAPPTVTPATVTPLGEPVDDEPF